MASYFEIVRVVTTIRVGFEVEIIAESFWVGWDSIGVGDGWKGWPRGAMQRENGNGCDTVDTRNKASDGRLNDEGIGRGGRSGPANWAICVKGYACFQDMVVGRGLGIGGRCTAGGLSGGFGKEDLHGCYKNSWSCR